MYAMNLSSDSQSDDENFQKHFKQVNYQGSFSDSEHHDSQMDESNSEESKKQHHLERKATANKSSDPLDKSKIIKKNCQSAKMSRQRKKLYLQMLEKKAKELKQEVFKQKSNLRETTTSILQKFSRSNREKYKYLVQKLSLSKRLLQMSEQIQQIRKSSQDKNGNSNTNIEVTRMDIQKNVFQETLVSINLGINQKPQIKTKPKRKRGNFYANDKNNEESKVTKKQQVLNLAINAFLYEFGVRGSLRTDVLQRTKSEWFENIQKSLVGSSQSSVKMKELLQKLQQKSKKLDYYLRELKDRVKQKFVIQFLLDRQYFLRNKMDTIYKKSQIISEQVS